jgi:hypothetical protein
MGEWFEVDSPLMAHQDAIRTGDYDFWRPPSLELNRRLFDVDSSSEYLRVQDVQLDLGSWGGRLDLLWEVGGRNCVRLLGQPVNS